MTGSPGERLYRAMEVDADGLPMLGETARRLGARPGTDIPLGRDGLVAPGTGGMSVSPDTPENLPLHRRPPEWGGTGKDPVWLIGSLALGPGLVYRPDPELASHGFVEPSRRMPLDAYQAALAGTRAGWSEASP